MRNINIRHENISLQKMLTNKCVYKRKYIIVLYYSWNQFPTTLVENKSEMLLKNMLDNYMSVKAIESRKYMKSLGEVITDLTELDIFTTGFEKRAEHLEYYSFTYYMRKSFYVLNK